MSKKDHRPHQTNSPREDVYSRVTARIVADLERGTSPWMKPWSAAHTAGRITMPLRSNGMPYRGMNVLLLWGEAVAKGYTMPTWMTYRQAVELGAQVRKGEQESLVVYANSVTRTETDEQGKEHECSIPFMKSYTVFNVEQIDGLAGSYQVASSDSLSSPARISSAEQFAAATAADIRHGDDRAFYSPVHDFVKMPPFEAFGQAERYYGVLLHELTHWSGHCSRLDRHFDDGRQFDSAGYAFEELIAELGAAFVCAELGVTPDVREDHAAYLAH